MPFQSKTYRVLIASPSDLTKERQIATEAIHEWNAQHSDAESVVLLAVKWETHAMPKSGVPPQEAINRQLVDKCDILIGMFWTKLGTKTGAADSGTVEEVNQFVAAGKPALLYFSSRPIDPNKIDYAQHRKLKKFQDYTYKNALIGTFNQPNKLRQNLLRDLLRQVRELKRSGDASDEKTETEVRRLRDEVEQLTIRTKEERARLEEREILKQELVEVNSRLGYAEAKLAESEFIREKQSEECQSRVAVLSSRLESAQLEVEAVRKLDQDSSYRDELLIRSIAGQLHYGRTFTDSLNLVRLLSEIGKRCSSTPHARKLFSEMVDLKNFTGSKIDYVKVARSLLEGWESQ